MGIAEMKNIEKPRWNIFRFIRLMISMTVSVWKSRAFVLTCINSVSEDPCENPEHRHLSGSAEAVNLLRSQGKKVGHMELSMTKSGNLDDLNVFKLNLDYILNSILEKPSLLVPTIMVLRDVVGVLSKTTGPGHVDKILIETLMKAQQPEPPQTVN